jgi:hypothetical protein
MLDILAKQMTRCCAEEDLNAIITNINPTKCQRPALNGRALEPHPCVQSTTRSKKLRKHHSVHTVIPYDSLLTLDITKQLMSALTSLFQASA